MLKQRDFRWCLYFSPGKEVVGDFTGDGDEYKNKWHYEHWYLLQIDTPGVYQATIITDKNVRCFIDDKKKILYRVESGKPW